MQRKAGPILPYVSLACPEAPDADVIRKIVDTFPPFTQSQRDQLKRLLSGSAEPVMKEAA